MPNHRNVTQSERVYKVDKLKRDSGLKSLQLFA